MEAVPRLPMLSFDLKTSPETPAFGPKLKMYIRDAYGEDPELYTNEIANLERARASAVIVSRSVNSCSNLKQYFCQLHFLQSRFPLSKDSSIAITFTWQDLYGELTHSSSDIRFEMASILYNIGALHSHLGASEARQTSDEMKMCCSHFQCGAWAFQQIQEFLPAGASTDLPQPLQRFMYNIMLAQAQECILEKSMLDSRKPLITAKVAVQIVDYYNIANTILENKQDTSLVDLVGSKFFKGWKRYVRLKITYYRCIVALYQGQQAEEQQKMGERVAYYQKASDILQEAIKLGKNMDNIQETLTFATDVVEGKKKAAKNENEFIYHEQVPDVESLPEIKGASLVKGIPFDVNDPEISGPDIFARLVPLQAHEASSLYSEEKAKLRRKMGEQIDEKDTELAAFMSSLQLEHLSKTIESIQIPQELIDRCASMNGQPNAIPDLIDIMNKLSDTYHDVDSMLTEITELLELESTREREYQIAMGSRPPSIAATDLTREAAKYREAHAKASESNRTLHKAITMHMGNLKTLGLPLKQLLDQLPPIVEPSDIEEAEASLQEMRNLVAKVEEMRCQRAMLNNELRSQTSRDDITNQIVTSNEPLDILFNKEMNKHQKLVSLIQQNLSAQENILKALTEAYAHHVTTRRTTIESQRRREASISALIASSDAYEDLLAKSNKGLEFYRKLETNVTKLLQRVKGTCKVQDEEREQILIKNNKKISSQEITSFPKNPVSTGPKLKDYLASMNAAALGTGSLNVYPPSVRPAPVGSEAAITDTDAILASKYIPSTTNYLPSTQINYHQPTYSSGQSYTGSYGVYPQSIPSSLPSAVDNPNPSRYNSNNTTYPPPLTSPNYKLPSGTTNPVTKTPGSLPSNPHYQGQILESNLAYHTPGSPSSTSQYQGQIPGTSLPYQNASPATGHHYQGQTSATNPAYQTPGTHITYQTPGSPASGPQYQSQTSGTNLPYQTQPANPYTVNTNDTFIQNPNYQTDSSKYQHPNQSYPGYTAYPTGYNYLTATTTTTNFTPPNDSVYQTPTTSVNTYPTTSNSNPTNAPDQSYGQIPQSSTNYQPPIVTQAYQPVSSTLPNNYPSYGYNQTYNPYPPSANQSTYSTSSQANQSPLNLTTTFAQSLPMTSTATATNPYQSTDSTSVFSNYPSTNQPGKLSASPVPSPSKQQTYKNSPAHQATPSTQSSPNEDYMYQEESTSQQNNYVYPYGYNNNNGLHSYQQSWASYGGHPGYSFDTSTGEYTYSSGYSTQGTPTGGYRQAGIASTATHTSAGQLNANNSGQASASAYYSAPYGQQQPQQTYVQAGLATPATTPSNGNNGTSEGANIDLLAGIDFSPKTPPLVPQTRPFKQETNIQKSQESPTSNNVLSKDCSSHTPPTTITISTTVTSAPITSIQKESDVKLSLPSLTTSVSNSNNSLPVSIPELITSTNTAPKPPPDPYEDVEIVERLGREIDALEKLLEGSDISSRGGPLDLKWQDALAQTDKIVSNRGISVARCYPMKNRSPDVLPYDWSRVELPSTKDDYINASLLESLTPGAPPLILTQSPMAATLADFWTMIWQQQVELIVCLVADPELGNEPAYWPKDKSDELSAGRWRVSLQSANVQRHWTERILSLMEGDTRATRVVVHLQMTGGLSANAAWSTPNVLAEFLQRALYYYTSQRSLAHRVCVHGWSEEGRSTCFALAAAALTDLAAGRPLFDLDLGLAKLGASRRAPPAQRRDHWRLAYNILLFKAKELFNEKRGGGALADGQEMSLNEMMSGGGGAEAAARRTHSRDSSLGGAESTSIAIDPLSQIDPLWPLKRF